MLWERSVRGQISLLANAERSPRRLATCQGLTWARTEGDVTHDQGMNESELECCRFESRQGQVFAKSPLIYLKTLGSYSFLQTKRKELKHHVTHCTSEWCTFSQLVFLSFFYQLSDNQVRHLICLIWSWSRRAASTFDLNASTSGAANPMTLSRKSR